MLPAMFELIFASASLFEAAVWFIGGLLLSAIGLAFGVDSFLYRRRAIKKRARILGVIRRRSGKRGQASYWPVYEHTSDEGELIHTAGSASGGLAGNLPGSFREVLVDPEDPYDVRSLVPVGMIVGAICAALGGVLFAISNSVHDDLGLVTLFAAAILAVMAIKAIVVNSPKKPITRGRLKRMLRERKKQKRPRVDASKVLSRDEHLAALRKSDAAQRKWLPLAALVGLALLAFGVWRGRDLVWLQSAGSRVDGVVVRIESEYNPDAENSSYTYYSVVRFETAAGREVTFRDSIGASHPIDKKDEVVGVIYDPADLDRAMIDRGLWNWAIPAGCASAGALVFWASVHGWLGAWRRRTGFPRGEQSV